MENIDQDNNLPKFGEKFKQHRLEKNLSYDLLQKKTKISINFIKFFEEEKWDELPVLAYSYGLLENLLIVMKLKPKEKEELLEIFKTIYKHRQNKKKEKIQERINLNQSKSFINIWFFLLILFFIIVILALLYFNNSKPLNLLESSSINEKVEKKTYSLYSKFNTFDLVKDDIVRVFYKNQITKVTLIESISFEGNTVVVLDFNNEKLIKVKLFEEVSIDLDDNGSDDLIVKFQKLSGEVLIIYFSLINENVEKTNFELIWNNQEKTEIGKEKYVLVKDQNKTPIQIFIKASTLPVYLSYNLDGQRQNSISLQPGNSVNLIGQNHIEIQIGNFRSVILVVNYSPIKFKVDKEDQFGITKIVKWLPSFRNETMFDLVIKDIVE